MCETESVLETVVPTAVCGALLCAAIILSHTKLKEFISRNPWIYSLITLCLCVFGGHFLYCRIKPYEFIPEANHMFETAAPAVICCGVVLYSVLVLLRSKSYKVSFFHAWLYLLAALPLCIFGGHLVFCIVQPHIILEDHSIGFFFMPWQGRFDFLMYGVLGMMVLSAFLVTRCKNGSMRSLLDLCVLPTAILIAVIRVVEPICGMGYGKQIADDGSSIGQISNFLSVFSFIKDPQLPDDQFLAVFAFEMYAAVCMAVYAVADHRKRPEGEKALLFIVQYASCQVFFEFLRDDNFAMLKFVRVSQIMSAAILLAILVVSFVRKREYKWGLKWSGVFLIVAAICVGFAFLEDKSFKLGDAFIYVGRGVCYAVIALCGIALGCISWYAYTKCKQKVQ